MMRPQTARVCKQDFGFALAHFAEDNDEVGVLHVMLARGWTKPSSSTYQIVLVRDIIVMQRIYIQVTAMNLRKCRLTLLRNP
jgi:hypothetical protein